MKLIEVDDKDIMSCVKRAVKNNPIVGPKSKIDEAYVAQQKIYAQTTDALSERAKKHHETLYKSGVETLTRVSIEIDSADKDAANDSNSRYRSLKKEETYNLNAVYLHELFFANCFDPNSELFQDTLAYIRLQRDWGSFETWMRDFMACAMSARNGWVVCGYSLYLKKIVNTVVDGNDDGAMIGLIPILVIDMWEHAYVGDYAADKKSYLTALMGEIDWEVVEDRVKRVDALKEVLG